MTTLSDAIAQLGLEFFRHLSDEHPTDNLCFSPVNLTGSIGLLFYGSGIKSAAELEKVCVV